MVLRYVVNGVWGIFDDFFRIFHILVTHPVPILSALFVIWLVYRIFRYMGFGQRRSILLSAPYQNGEHYASNLRANISDPHQFYLQEAGVLMRPTYCNVCSQRMLGASDIALSCDICGFAAHDHCVPRITQGCKSVSLLPTPALAFSFDCAFRTLTSGALLPPLPPRARACRGGASGLCGSSSTMTNVSLFSASSASAAGTANDNDHECDEEDDDGEEEENEADVLALATPVEHAAAFSSALAAAAASSAAAAAAVAAAGVGVGVGKAGRGVLVRRYRALIEERKHEEWCASALAITAAAAAARIAADAEAAAAVAAAAEGGDACPETAVMVQPKRTATRASASTSGGGSSVDQSDGVVTLRRSARVRSRSRPAHARALVSDASAAANGDDSGDGNDDVKDDMSSSQVVSRSSTSAVAAAATAATAAAAAAAAAAASAASGAHVGGLTSPAQPHHWTRGNHSTLSDVCIACGEVTGSLFSLSGLHCLWCRANVHEGCVVDVGRTHAHCSRGAIAKLIVPPTSVFPAPGFTAASARLAISSLRRGAPAPPAAPASPSDADAAAPAPAAAVGGSSGRVLTLGGLVSDIVKGTAPAAEGISQWDPLLHAAAPVAAAVAAAAGASDFAALSAESSSSPSSAAAAAAAAAAAGSVSDSATAASCGHVLPPLSSLLALPPSDPLLTTPLVYRVLPPPDVTPLLVFVNRKSGGNTGIQLMHEFAELLSPIQVWDLSEHPPEVALSLFATVPRLQAVVCGGDGTVSWVLSAIDKLGRPIPLAVVPLGTGNDLSQVLGWGKTSPGMDGSGLLPTLQRVARAGICVLDRWNAEVKPLPMLEGADEHGAATMTAATESAGASERKELSAQRSKPSSQSRVLRTPGPTRRRLPATARPAATAAVVVVEGPVSESGVEHKESSGKAARSNDDDDDDDDDDAVLHSGHSCWQRLKASPLVQRISAVFPVVTPSPRGRGSSSAVVCNYMGIGLDAVIAHKFHRLRANYPHLFSSQLLNKMWYARLGSDAYFFPHAPTVLQDSKVQVFVDGTELDLTNMQGVCLLNIKSFGGGINFWGIAPTEARFQEPSMDDSMLEVIGFESSLHIGTIQMGMGTPHRLAQGRNIVIRTRGPLPFQVDGEPWGVKTHCEVHVTLRGQSLMMTPDDGSAAVGGGPLAGAGDVLGARAAAAGATAAGLGATAMLNDTLHWAQARGVISEAQAQVILTEFSKKHRKMLPSNTRFYEARTHTGD